MTPRIRRAVQAVLYETLAVAFVGPVLSLIFEQPASSTITLAIFMSTVALVWNYVFNSIFERWESRQKIKGRSIWRRLAHGLGFEGGLVVMLVPVMAYWLQSSLLHAFIADLGFLAFFFVYAIVFNWAFDALFGLPDSAKGDCEA
ncbi:MAG: PACE efflux transporter [Pseudomonadota bacterium]